MSILPVTTYELQSSAKPSELVLILGEHVDSFPIIFPWSDRKAFAGTITESGFHIVRIGQNRNSFRPTLFGVFLQRGSSTIIRITIKHSASFFIGTIFFSLVPAAIGLLIVALFILPALLRADTQEILEYLPPLFLFSLLGPLIILFVSYAFARLCFSSEAKAARNELREILSHVIDPGSGQ